MSERLDVHRMTGVEISASTLSWLDARGYKGALAESVMPGITAVVIFARGNEPARLAVLGDTLVFDGQDVTIE